MKIFCKFNMDLEFIFKFEVVLMTLSNFEPLNVFL